jgi:hypothetical protein
MTEPAQLAAIFRDLNNVKVRLQGFRSRTVDEAKIRYLNRALYEADAMRVPLLNLDSILAQEGKGKV